VLISSFRLHPLADLTRLWEALHGGKVTLRDPRRLNGRTEQPWIFSMDRIKLVEGCYRDRRNEGEMHELLTLLNFAVALMALGGMAVLLHKTRRIHLKLFIFEDEIRALRTTDSVNLYRQVQAFMELRDLLQLVMPMPPLRLWAASPDFLLVIARHALASRPEIIVECSSGSSTLVLAQAARHSGVGHVYSLEHDPIYAEQTRSLLADHGLQNWATIIDAPLAIFTISGKHYHWYDDTGLASIGPINMLVIDGPPYYVNPLARYPAGTKLFPRLAPNAAVFLDDAARPDETQAVVQWMESFPYMKRHTFVCEKGCIKLTMPAGDPIERHSLSPNYGEHKNLWGDVAIAAEGR
jgi:predicted O-methyltransferase YrrM